MLISNCKTWNLRSTNEGAVKSYVPKLLRSRAWIPQAITDLSGRPTKKKQGLMFFTLKRGVVKSAVRLRRSGRLRKREIGRSVNGKAISERKKRADDAIQRINCYLVDLCWQILMLCPPDRDLSNRKRYPTFDRWGPSLHVNVPFSVSVPIEILSWKMFSSVGFLRKTTPLKLTNSCVADSFSVFKIGAIDAGRMRARAEWERGNRHPLLSFFSVAHLWSKLRTSKCIVSHYHLPFQRRKGRSGKVWLFVKIRLDLQTDWS